MKKSRAPAPVVIAVLTMLTVFFWIIFDILRIVARPEEVDVSSEILQELNPNLDTNILSTLQNRVFLNDSEISDIVISTPLASPTPSPQTPSEDQVETSTETPSPTPSEETLNN